MNKTHKDIAGIIKKCKDNCRCNLCRISNKRFERLTKELADKLFKKQEDKNQFLKECGVE